jgi:hypothetical protein
MDKITTTNTENDTEDMAPCKIVFDAPIHSYLLMSTATTEAGEDGPSVITRCQN